MWLWTNGGKDYTGKWPKNEIEEINGLLKRLNQYKPMEIHRAIRTLSDLKFWKGTEFRSFLLYYGMVILKKHLISEQYEHFLLLTCAVRIFYVDAYKIYRHIAKKWLIEYIEGYINIFGIHSIGSNVHNLSHIFDDVECLGSLNEISTYPFENRLSLLKMRVKQPNLPLPQIARRIAELSIDYDTLFGVSTPQQTKPELKLPYKLGDRLVYKTVIIDSDLTLSIQKQCNSWFLTKNDEIVRMQYAFSMNNDIIICGNSLKYKESFFKKTPVSSQRLHIYKSDGDTNDASSYRLDTIKAKMMYFPVSQTDFVFMPLLHTMK